MRKKVIATVVGAGLTAGLVALGAGGAFASGGSTAVGGSNAGGGSSDATGAAAARPPKGARAVVKVTPNPTTRRGQEVTITGHCGGGTGLKQVIAGLGGKPVLEDIRIIDDNPKGFLAKARLSATIGNGVGPVFVDCGGEAGVTLLVTHV